MACKTLLGMEKFNNAQCMICASSKNASKHVMNLFLL